MKALVGDGVAAFPPRVEWLQAWGTMFRCSGTFSNYLGYAKVGCLLAKEDTRVFQHPAVRRAKDSVAKSGRFASREKLWIRRHRIEALMKWAEVWAFVVLAAVVLWCPDMSGQPSAEALRSTVFGLLHLLAKAAV